MDIEQDFENDSENLDDVDAELDHKNFTGKLQQFMISEDSHIKVSESISSFI